MSDLDAPLTERPQDPEELRFQISAELPPNRTLLEYDIAAVTNRINAIDYTLRAKLDPRTCSMATLPFLAWGVTTQLWDEDWPESRKRQIVIKARYLHCLAGTEAGIREHIRYTDTKLVKVVAPPVQFFPSRAYTKAERDAFLAVMPQLRLYRFKDQGDRRGKMFCTKKPVAQRAFGGRANRAGWPYRMAARLTDAQVRIGTQSYLFDQGTLTKLTTARVIDHTVTEQAVNTYTIKKPGNAGKAFFTSKGRRFGGGMPILGGQRIATQLYSITVNDSYDHSASELSISTITPTLTPVDARFNYVQEHGIARKTSLFPGTRSHSKGQILHGKCLPRSTARDRLYQQMYLYDPSRGIPLRRGRCFAGHSRLGVPAFTAELSVEIINRRPRNSFGDFVRGFLHKTNPKKLNMALRAIRISKAARDKTLVRLGLYQIPMLGKGLPLDTDYRFGDRVRNYR